MVRLTLLFVTILVTACAPSRPATPASSDRPMRIVSLDYCADQYVIKLADRDQILAVSPEAVRPFSYMRDAARDLPTVPARAEDVLLLKPDLVVRSYGGGPRAGVFFERAGIPVLQLGWASAIDGEEAGSIPYLIQDIAVGLGQAERGETLVQTYRDRLANIQSRQKQETALYMTQAGVTTGPGSLIHDMIVAAGLSNYEDTPGWRSLPLERMVYQPPEIVAAGFFAADDEQLDAWSSARHPIARAELAKPATVTLPGAWLSCGGWYLVDAIEALAEGAER